MTTRINDFEEMLTGGHPNSLGKTEEVVNEVLRDTSKAEDLFRCYESTDEIVRLRVSSAFKRIAKAQPELVLPITDRFLALSSSLKQSSFQWSFAQIMTIPSIDNGLTSKQKKAVLTQLKQNLDSSDDWIVLNVTAEALAGRASLDKALRTWLMPRLKKLREDSRKSVARRAKKHYDRLQEI